MTDILLLSLITNAVLFAKLANRNRMLAKAVQRLRLWDWTVNA